MFLMYKIGYIDENGEPYFWMGVFMVLQLGLLIYLCMCLVDRWKGYDGHRADPENAYIPNWDDEPMDKIEELELQHLKQQINDKADNGLNT